MARKTEEKEGGSEDGSREERKFEAEDYKARSTKVQGDDLSHLPKSHTLFSARTGGRAVWWG